MPARALIISIATVLTVAMRVAFADGPVDTPASAFTAEQAAAGRTAYTRQCAGCHMPDLSGNGDVPQLSGDIFRSSWRTRSTKDLFDYLAATMPPEGPRAGMETYLAISAYILQANGVATGAEPLTGATTIPLIELLPGR